MERWDVLVVDDDRTWRRNLEQLFDSAALSCVTSASYDSALTLLSKLRPSALVIDLELGGALTPEVWEGWDLAQRAKELELASVIVTAHSKASNWNRALRDLSAVAFFDKSEFPECEAAFIARVREAIKITEKRRMELEYPARTRMPLLLSSQEDKFFLQFQSGLMGDINVPFIKPFSSAAIQLILELIASENTSMNNLTAAEKKLLQTVRIKAEAPRDLLEQVGMLLYDSLTKERAGLALESELNKAKIDETGLSFSLAMDASWVELSRYPWELIHDTNRFLADGRIGLSRYIMIPEPIKEIDLKFPLRVLVLCPRPHEVPILPNCEYNHIKSELDDAGLNGEFIFDEVRPPTFSRLKSMLTRAKNSGKPYSVLYYDGHADWGWICRRCGNYNDLNSDHCTSCHNSQQDATVRNLIFLEDGKSKAPDPIDANRLATALSQSNLKLVLLSACTSADVRGSTIFNALGPNLIREGIPAVIGMQFPITSSDTVAFFSQLFLTLGGKNRVSAELIEEAVRDARVVMKPHRWFFPVLYLRTKAITRLQ